MHNKMGKNVRQYLPSFALGPNRVRITTQTDRGFNLTPPLIPRELVRVEGN